MSLLLACSAGIFLSFYFGVAVLLPASLIGTALFILMNLSSGVSLFACFGQLLTMLISAQAWVSWQD